MEPEEGKLPPEAAREILKLGFAPSDRARMDLLARKAREGALGVDESVELDTYLRVNDLLTTLQSRARKALGDVQEQ